MKIIREKSEHQILKLHGEFLQSDMSTNITTCDGECWDCDDCGGARTH